MVQVLIRAFRSLIRGRKYSQRCVRIEFRASSDFVDRLEYLSATLFISEEKVIETAIKLLERVVEEDQKGNGFVFAPLQQ